MTRIVTTTRHLRARLVAALALAALMITPALAPGSSAIDQYDESVPNVDGSHQPSSGSSGSNGSSGGSGATGSASAGGLGDDSATGNSAQSGKAGGDGLSASGSDGAGTAGGADRSASSPGGALQASVDSPPVSAWALAIAGLALGAAVIRAGIALRSRRRTSL